MAEVLVVLVAGSELCGARREVSRQWPGQAVRVAGGGWQWGEL